MATKNAVGNSLTGSSGTGVFVGGTGPTITTPNVVGTSTNNNATAGSLGEVITSNIPYASRISILNNTVTDLTSISLTAGDWDVWGSIGYNPNTTTAYTAVFCWVNSTSATLTDLSLLGSVYTASAVGGMGANITAISPIRRFSLASTTTLYLSGYCMFTVSTMQMNGLLYARRVR